MKCHAGVEFESGKPCPKCGARLGEVCWPGINADLLDLAKLREENARLREAANHLHGEPQEAPEPEFVADGEFHFWMDMRRFTSTRSRLTGAEIKALAGTSSMYPVFRDTGPRVLDHQGIGDGELVSIDGQHFYSLIPATHRRGDIG